MRRVLCNIVTKTYDKDHPNSPMTVEDRRGNTIVSLRKSLQHDDVLEAIDTAIELGQMQGRKQAKDEIRSVLGL